LNELDRLSQFCPDARKNMKQRTCHGCGELMEIRTRTMQSFGLNVCLAFLGGLFAIYGYIVLRSHDDIAKACVMWGIAAFMIFCPWFVGNKERKVWYCKTCRYFLEMDRQ